MDLSLAAPVYETASAENLILIPVMDTILLPGTVMPLTIGRPAAVAAVQEAARTEQHLAVVLQRSKRNAVHRQHPPSTAVLIAAGWQGAQAA